ncbi:hypothetical protein AGOR_G00015810 [Albula goreensis]|uniref:poly(ADP-ribose) glycohydrolase n=1 Tax=Albula goreensis TaxID=1534307 RepID=A0A8T3E7Y0_9TELE|nr:hypothetical protein AGOR_G00015810 [Albula goreensis]
MEQRTAKVAKLEEDQAVHSEASMDSADGAEGDLSSAQKEEVEAKEDSSGNDSPVSMKQPSSSSEPPDGDMTILGGEPSTNEPSISKPSTIEPSTIEPSISKPSTIEPSTSEPSTTEPSTSEPSTIEPSTTEPSTSTCDYKQKGKEPEEVEVGRDDSEIRCCSLEELHRVPGCAKPLGPLSFSGQHTVLVDVDAFNKKSVLVVQDGQPMWDGNSVRMPYAPENTLKSVVFKDVQPRWITIKKELGNLAKSKSVTSSEVERAIKKYNPKYQHRWTFDALHHFFKVLPVSEKPTYSRTLSRIAELALKLPDCCKKNIPLLQDGQSKSITLSQVQIASLLANAFYCTFPRRNATGPHAEYSNYPIINFQSLFGQRSERKGQKFRAIFHYFQVVTGVSTVPRGLVTFSRCHMSTFPNWKSCTALLPKLYITSEGLIEKDGQGMLQVDFSHNLVGGGVLGNGLVQEEILFLINPELIVARLFTEKLGDNDCLKITGSQQYSKYTGYSDSFRWTGPHEDKTPRDEWQRRHRQIVAIDALHLKNPKEQYNMKDVRRELNKAYCGFKGEDKTNPDCYPAVATGNWGCGVFGGDPRLKVLIQLMAAAEARRDMAYFTFEMKDLEMDILRMYNFLKTNRITVAQLYKSMEKFWEEMRTNGKQPSDLYSCIRSYLEKSKSKN